jgi:hypothetical protein
MGDAAASQVDHGLPVEQKLIAPDCSVNPVGERLLAVGRRP